MKRIRSWGWLIERVGIAIVGMALGTAMYEMCSCDYSSRYDNERRECACSCDKEKIKKVKTISSGMQDLPWCKKAVERGYLTSKELNILRQRGYIRWVRVMWSSPSGDTWERVVIPMAKDRFRYIRSDYRSYGNPETIDVVMFETNYILSSTRQLVVKAHLGSYEPARIYEADIIRAYEDVRGSYLRTIGEEI